MESRNRPLVSWHRPWGAPLSKYRTPVPRDRRLERVIRSRKLPRNTVSMAGSTRRL